MTDLQRLRGALGPVEALARKQPWDRERPWRASTHVWLEDGVVVVDLHDLKVKPAKAAVDAVVAAALDVAVEGGAVVFVTGRGKHSSGRAVLPEVVLRKLAAASRERLVWRAVPLSGRVVLVTDPSRAPARYRSGLGVVFWLGVAGFVALAVWLLATG